MTDVKATIREYMERRNRYWVSGDLESLAEFWATGGRGNNWEWLREGWERRLRLANARACQLLRAHSHVRLTRLDLKAEGNEAEVELQETIHWVYRDGIDYAVEGRMVRHWQCWNKSEQGVWQITHAQESDETRPCPRPGPDGGSGGMDRQVDAPRPALRALLRRFTRPTCNEYDRVKALRYAELWWNRPNPQYVYFRADDCTNFASQCLYSAGVPMHDTGDRASGWWYRFNDSGADTWSLSWSIANALHLYLVGQVQATELASARELKIGDLIFYDWNGQGRYGHSTVVVDFDQQGDPLVNAHTDASYHRHYLYLDSRAWSPQTRYAFVHLPQRVC
ncbi:amidase domain-containing protein [Alicyclobacillus shizuokensis]|uniref:amidase domain-containing protein n=1 Tax=Alicyclobacillus shizuokensis TaxID=392014 RepID=UPI0008339CB8|nr:amidase domain-containing protein [Alicyclobacillus shizuokensis]MCL6626209.1 amidase domain-containing protein [Alicyclobacillus shizuokensis]